jgi:hypothetical protein
MDVSTTPTSTLKALLPLTVEQFHHWAPSWFTDALGEATSGKPPDPARREIVFATCFLESYIFEWVHDLRGAVLNDYFPPKKRFKDDPRYRRSLEDKWKCVPEELFDDKVLRIKRLLVKYRNGLVHAAASRPVIAGQRQTEAEKRTPPLGKMHDPKTKGWALTIAVDLVRDLHKQLGTKEPPHLKAWPP